MDASKATVETDQTSLYILLVFVWFDSLCPSQQFFSHVGMGLPVLNQC